MSKASSVAATLLAAASFGALADDMLVSEYSSARERELTKQYVAGAGEAIYIMNYRLEKLGKLPLYCPPATVRLNTQNYIAILDQELMRQGKRELFGLFSISDVLLDGLIRSFPCKDTKVPTSR